MGFSLPSEAEIRWYIGTTKSSRSIMTTSRAFASETGSAPSDRETRGSEVIQRFEKAIFRNAGGQARFRREIPLILRQSMDEVIDTPRTGRSQLDETKMIERIYLATKVRVRLKSFLRFPRGKLHDVVVGGVEAGIQSTVGRTWHISPAMVGFPCILIKTDPRRRVCSVGTIVIRDETLSPGKNPSGRRTISCAGLAGVRWILKDEPLPDLP